MAKSNKSILRVKYQNIRNEIRNKQKKAEIICEKVLNETEYKNANVIAIYRNLPSETDTTMLIEKSLELGKIVALPRVVAENRIEFYKIKNLENLEKSELGIEEPSQNEDNLISKEMLDLMIVPAVSFDLEKNRLGFGKGCYDYYLENSKNRLGYGGGYYDRFLYRTDTIKIGICFDEQISSIVFDNEKFDIKMDKIITEKNIW